MRLAIVDVDYRGTGARAACIVADGWCAAAPIATYTCDIDTVQPYEPGLFYKRELPCVLAVLDRVKEPLDAIVIDGYVWLSCADRPGLGARLHETLVSKTPVVGIAKTAFAGAATAAVVAPVLRGSSASPLYVTSIGMALDVAAQQTRLMHGPSRIPTLLRLVDQLARSA